MAGTEPLASADDMSQIFESMKLALSSIWANKLRSLLTLLGNIVAVSSIITVVSLITGVNGAVTRRDRVGSRRRLVHDSAHGHHAERGRVRAPAQQPASSRSTTRRRSSDSARPCRR